MDALHKEDESPEMTLAEANRKARQRLFLDKIEQYGNITRACKAAKIPRRTIYGWIEDEVFKVQYDASCKVAIDMLIDEAKRRAFEGVKEPVFHLGKKIGHVVKYSDTLLMFLIKSLGGDEYRPVVRNEHSGRDGKPIETNSKVVISNVDYDKLDDDTLRKIAGARIEIKD